MQDITVSIKGENVRKTLGMTRCLLAGLLMIATAGSLRAPKRAWRWERPALFIPPDKSRFSWR
jgi:hypothetical protein